MQTDGPQAIVARELPTLGPIVFYTSRELAAVKLETIIEEGAATRYAVTLAGLVEGDAGLTWYVIKRSEVITTPERAVSTYNTCTGWADRVSHAAVLRYTLAALEELL